MDWKVVCSFCVVAAISGAIVPAAQAETLMLDDSELVVEAELNQNTYWLGFGYDALWGMWRDQLLRFDPADNSVTKSLVPGASGRNRGISVGEGGIWLADTYEDTIFKVDPVSREVLLTIPVKLMQHYDGTIGIGEGSIWVAAPDGGKSWLMRYSADTGAEQARVPLPPSGWAIAVDYGSVWVTGSYKHEVYRIDAQSNVLVATIPIAGLPKQITSGEGGVWVVSQETGVIHRIDPATNSVVATFETGTDEEGKGDIVTGGGYVWATFRRVPLVQIDPKTDTVARIYSGFDLPGVEIAYGAGSLWNTGWGTKSVFRLAPPP